MRATVIHGPGDVRVEDRPEPEVVEPTDAVIRVTAACVCGSDLWPYRGAQPIPEPTPMGHEYVGVVEQIGDAVTTVSPGDTVVGSFVTSDGTCELCRAGFPSSCVNRTFLSSTQAELARIPNADGTLIATPGEPHDDDVVRDLLAVSDVMGTGWWAATAARVQPGQTVAVVGDGAVGLCGIIAAKQLGAERIIAMSRHEPRQELARQFGATDIVTERGDEGAQQVKELTDGLGAHATLECVGMQESFLQAIRSTRPGGNVGFVGVPHDVSLDAQELFFAQIGLLGGPAPVRRFLPDLIGLVWKREVTPGRVFDLELPLDDAAEGYAAMDERRAIKVLLRP